MIVSPRAREVTDVQRKAGNGFVKTGKVMLVQRTDDQSPYQGFVQWKRHVNTTVPAKFRPFAIVPQMGSSFDQGSAIYPSGTTAWQAFNRQANSSGAFGQNEPITVVFHEPRWIRAWSLQFAPFSANQISSFTPIIQGRLHNGSWSQIHGTPLSGGNVSADDGSFGITTPMQCTAVRIQTNQTTAVRACQFYDAVPLVPISMTSNTAPTGNGLTLNVTETLANSTNLFQAFRGLSTARQLGIRDWYYNGGTWQNNEGKPSTGSQNRFEIRFADPKTVGGFAVMGLQPYTATNCYANCLLVEGRADTGDYWRRIDEVKFDPSLRLTRYFDFPADHVVGQLRITVQSVMPGTSSQVYLPPMQVYGT